MLIVDGVKKSVCAVLLAAGSSVRMGSNKMLLRLCGRTPIEWCLDAFDGIADEAVIAVSEATADAAALAASSAKFPTKCVPGGARRQDSVRNALNAADAELVAVHDCARCLVDRDVIADSLLTAAGFGCGIASVPVIDTLRRAESGEIVERSGLLAAQTPQSFVRSALLKAYSDVCGDYTDDAALFRAAGNTLRYSRGSRVNAKLTTADDIPYFEFVLSRRFCGKEQK